MGKRLAVVVANHVVQEDDTAQLRPANAALLNLGIHAPVVPVAVGAQDPRQPARGVCRPVEIAAQGEARECLEHDLLDGVIIAIELAINLGIERRLGKHRPEPERNAQLVAKMTSPVAPGGCGRGRLEFRPLIVGADVTAATVGRRLDRVDSSPDQVQRRLEMRLRLRRQDQNRRHGQERFRLLARLSFFLVLRIRLGGRGRGRAFAATGRIIDNDNLDRASGREIRLAQLAPARCGAARLLLEMERQRLVRGGQPPPVLASRPDKDFRLAGDSEINACSQAGKVTCQKESGCSGRRTFFPVRARRDRIRHRNQRTSKKYLSTQCRAPGGSVITICFTSIGYRAADLSDRQSFADPILTAGAFDSSGECGAFLGYLLYVARYPIALRGAKGDFSHR